MRDSLTQLALDLGTVSDGSGRNITKVIQDIETSMKNIPGATNYASNFVALNDALAQLRTDVSALPKTDATTALTNLQSAVATVQQTLAQLPTSGATAAQASDVLAKLDTLQQAVKAVNTSGAGEQTAGKLDALSSSVESLKSQLTATTSTGEVGLLAKLQELQKSVESAQGSSAAVGLAQSASSAAQEAVTILRQLQTELQSNHPSPAVPALLGQFGEKMQAVSGAMTVIPGKLNAEEISQQLKALAEQAKGISSDKGYHFDALYEISQTQASDVKTVRNQVEELKALLELQRSILERNMDRSVVKTWFESQ